MISLLAPRIYCVGPAAVRIALDIVAGSFDMSVSKALGDQNIHAHVWIRTVSVRIMSN